MNPTVTVQPLGPVPRPVVVDLPRPPVRAVPAAPRLLHITNGDCAADLLRLGGVLGHVTLSADVLHEGPVPIGLPPERWRKVRARYLAESGYEGYDECLARLTEWDRAIDGFRSYDEVVLWFEHDLFDQLHLIRLLDGFSRREMGWTRLNLVCTGEYLGQLDPSDMTSLLEARRPVSAGQMRLARHAWRVFTSPEPIGLELLLRRDTSDLPYLAGALYRHLEEFPSVHNGLSRTEQQALTAAAMNPVSFEELFRTTQQMEERIFLGDLSLLHRLRELASRPRPLLRIDSSAGDSIRTLQISLTPTGVAVLEGREDWGHIHGIDRWLGGVHLQGTEASWRWDARQQRLVPTPL
ncbi:MAG TPA: hypothetical protein VMW27_12555 [Thermoanaerobaculia bacterium]|nr:hypothetical protein [Thermoanaerobaculia bacterium]